VVRLNENKNRYILRCKKCSYYFYINLYSVNQFIKETLFKKEEIEKELAAIGCDSKIETYLKCINIIEM
jgi:hypothetical protein